MASMRLFTAMKEIYAFYMGGFAITCRGRPGKKLVENLNHQLDKG